MKAELVIALDVKDEKRLTRILTNTSDIVNIYKIGFIAVSAFGERIFKVLAEAGAKIMLDLKFFDIPSVVKDTIEVFSKYPVELCTVHGIAGGEFIKALEGVKPKILAVTVLTSLENILGRRREELVLSIADEAISVGANGIVCPPDLISNVRGKLGWDFIIATPGIRISGEKDEHVKTFTPEEAARAGSNLIIVGRPVTLAENPRKVAQDIISSIRCL